MLVASTVHAEWVFEAETGFVYDSNLSNSDRSADVRDDWAWRSDVSVNNGLQLTRDLRLNLGADVRSDVWDRFDAFDTVVSRIRRALELRPAAEFEVSLRYLLGHERERRTIGEQGRRYVEREYRWGTVLAKLETVLETPSAE